MVIRHATAHDAGFLLRLRNAPGTLAWCGSTGPIHPLEHAQWFVTHLSELYVAEEDGLAIGSGRIVLEGSTARLSYTIDAAARGQGRGQEFVRLLVEQARLGGGRTVVCQIKRANRESVMVAMLGGVDSVEFLG